MFIAFLLQIYEYIYHYLLINVMIIRLIKRLIYFPFSEPRRLGPSICFESCLQARVSQVPEAVHLLCQGHGQGQTNHVLGAA